MGVKAGLSVPYARLMAARIRKWSSNPIKTQDAAFRHLLLKVKTTYFGDVHRLKEVATYEEFKKHVPVRDYEGLSQYVDSIVNGDKNILWPGRPMYLSKTSGTTSGTKYIPITRSSMPGHIHSARNALLSYIAETGKSDFVDGKMIFLQGSPKLDESGKIPTGRLSGIVANHVPPYLQRNRMPSHKTNCIEDWEEKVDQIVEETLKKDMRLISGIPSWVQMYFERLIEASGKSTIADIFPNFSLFVHGGVNYEPYRPIFEKMIGRSVDNIEVYPASEGFIAFQDTRNEEGLLLVLNKGIFYEFIPMDEYHEENPTRISLKDVEAGVNYAIILNTNAGLWGYLIGDTVMFTSTDPYRLVVTGRISHFTSAFGEHVISQEVDRAMQLAMETHGTEITEFHLAPQVEPPEGELPYHEWFIEFANEPNDMENFRSAIEEKMIEQNVYYKDLINGSILQPLKITRVRKGGFNDYMKSIGKLGGQNKVPRLANDRAVAQKLGEFAIQ